METLLVTLPPETIARLRAAAAARGMRVEDYAAMVLMDASGADALVRK